MSDPRALQDELSAAAEAGDLEAVRRLLDAGADPVAIDSEFETPLFLAVHKGHVAVVAEMLGRGANVDEPEEDGVTPLMSAALGSDVEMVQTLLDAGADPGAVDSCGQSAIVKAAEAGLSEIVELLTPVSPPEQQQIAQEELPRGITRRERGANQRITDFIMAAGMGELDVVRREIAAGIDLDARKEEGDTALQFAAWYGQAESVRLLIEAGADLNLKQDEAPDWTAVMGAVRMGRTEVVDLLIAAGADLNVRDRSGETALRLAMDFNRQEIAEALRKAGATE